MLYSGTSQVFQKRREENGNHLQEIPEESPEIERSVAEVAGKRERREKPPHSARTRETAGNWVVWEFRENCVVIFNYNF